MENASQPRRLTVNQATSTFRRTRGENKIMRTKPYGPMLLVLATQFALGITASEEATDSNQADMPCTTDAECAVAVSPFSVCLPSKGICSQPHTNPIEQGCLKAKLPGWDKLRVCNSEDLPQAAEQGICQPPSPHLDYLEIRIKCQDWESVIFGSWILQIILSELLQVPTTLETGVYDSVMQLYDTADRFEWGTTSNNLQAFRNANSVDGDCRNLQKMQNGTYRNCAHVIPEVWTANSAQVKEYISDDILDPPLSLGALGIEGWYIPKFTAQADPSLTSWIGLQGETNRQKLASMFLRPTKFGDYCADLSPTQCLTPDGVATRPPESEWEASALFVDGAYKGHFRNTTHNHCEGASPNCTGHIGDFPCGWGGSLEATCHHLNIALESNGDEPFSGGYTYSQLGQMWRAANATRNHVAMMWAIPDPIYEEFMGTDFEFVKVTLPAPTQSCIEKRINAEYRCVPEVEKRLGIAEGVCDEVARPLYKLMLKQLFDLTRGTALPTALHSPAHAVLSQFSLTELQINEMFQYWQTVQSGSLTPREGICQWAVDNLHHLKQFIPRSYPRQVEESSKSVMLYATTILGCIATLMVLGTTAGVVKYRKRRVFRYAQIEFLFLLLAGSALVSVGAILTGLQQHVSDQSCITQAWLLGLGYTLTLVPLLVKVAAINRLMQAAQRMRRVELNRSTLRGGVLLIGVLVALYLMIWTIVDPPQRLADYELTDNTLAFESNLDAVETLFPLDVEVHVVHVRYFCNSDSDFWQYVAVSWNLILILCATALAFQSRNVKQDFNEASVLSRLIYAHFLFVLLRVMSFFFDPWVSDPLLSMIYSLDTMVMLCVYFYPKFLADDQAGILNGRSSTYIAGASGYSQSAVFSSQKIPGSNIRVSGLFTSEELNAIDYSNRFSRREESGVDKQEFQSSGEEKNSTASSSQVLDEKVDPLRSSFNSSRSDNTTNMKRISFAEEHTQESLEKHPVIREDSEENEIVFTDSPAVENEVDGTNSQADHKPTVVALPGTEQSDSAQQSEDSVETRPVERPEDSSTEDGFHDT